MSKKYELRSLAEEFILYKQRLGASMKLHVSTLWVMSGMSKKVVQVILFLKRKASKDISIL